LPERRYEAAARVLAGALERAGKVPPRAVVASAHEAGLAIGAAARRAAGKRPGRRRRRDALMVALHDRGYEPRTEAGGDITLGNCPFHALVDDHRQLVCGMNLALADGVLDGLGEHHLAARLDPQPDRCCVVIGEPTGG
jgi:predicted ArsR family transcriptional regulator